MHVMIVACYHPLPLSACMLNFDLVSILFGTSIPTSFNILVKMFLHLYIYIMGTVILMCVKFYAHIDTFKLARIVTKSARSAHQSALRLLIC